MFKQDLALNNLQGLIYYKTQLINQPKMERLWSFDLVLSLSYKTYLPNSILTCKCELEKWHLKFFSHTFLRRIFEISL